MSSIYSISSGASAGTVALDQVWKQTDGGVLTAGYSSLIPVQVGTRVVLFGYDKEKQTVDGYNLLGSAPWIEYCTSQADLPGGPWDIVNTFILGSEPYLLTYRQQDGILSFFRIADDLSLSKPYIFYPPRTTPSAGFTVIQPFTSLGFQYMLAYNTDTGKVANFSIAVKSSSSEPDIPPLLGLNVWYHEWAKSWKHFAFFQFGGSNFFFKINTGKLNVNIDHIQDDPAMGTVEVGSHLETQLPDALSIDAAAPVPWNAGETYLLTYIASSGVTAVYRIHPDCLGWSELNTSITVIDASHVVPYRIGDRSFVLYYQGDVTTSHPEQKRDEAGNMRDIQLATSSQLNSMGTSEIHPVPPDAARVWRGFRLPTVEPNDFQDKLGNIFIPATAQLQRLYGLTAYLPTVLPVTKAVGVPDEIALVFYETQQAYKDATLAVGGRAYGLLHATIFDLSTSKSGFPVAFNGQVVFDTPYYLFNNSVDWQSGWSQVFVGARHASVTEAKFAAGLQNFILKLKQQRPAALDGAIIFISRDWVTYWEHWKIQVTGSNTLISELDQLSDCVTLQRSAPTRVESSLQSPYIGLDAVGGKSFNILFPRLAESASATFDKEPIQPNKEVMHMHNQMYNRRPGIDDDPADFMMVVKLNVKHNSQGKLIEFLKKIQAVQNDKMDLKRTYGYDREKDGTIREKLVVGNLGLNLLTAFGLSFFLGAIGSEERKNEQSIPNFPPGGSFKLRLPTRFGIDRLVPMYLRTMAASGDQQYISSLYPHNNNAYNEWLAQGEADVLLQIECENEFLMIDLWEALRKVIEDNNTQYPRYRIEIAGIQQGSSRRDGKAHIGFFDGTSDMQDKMVKDPVWYRSKIYLPEPSPAYPGVPLPVVVSDPVPLQSRDDPRYEGGTYLVYRKYLENLEKWFSDDFTITDMYGKIFKGEEARLHAIGRNPHTGRAINRNSGKDLYDEPDHTEINLAYHEAHALKARGGITAPFAGPFPPVAANHANSFNTQDIRLRRRGIAFQELNPLTGKVDYGLHFIAFQNNIQQTGFEFINNIWLINPDFHRSQDGLMNPVGEIITPLEGAYFFVPPEQVSYPGDVFFES